MTTQPVYQARSKRYGIDRCEPQKQAIREGKIELYALTKGHYPGTPVPVNVLPGLNSIGFWNAGSTRRTGARIRTVMKASKFYFWKRVQ